MQNLWLVDDAGEQRQTVTAGDDEQERTVEDEVDFFTVTGTAFARTYDHCIGSGSDTLFVDGYAHGVVDLVDIDGNIGTTGSEIGSGPVEDVL